GDKIAVMRDGVVQQFGSPQDIYDRPANMFVAGFIGSPSMNFIRGKVQQEQQQLHFVLEHQGRSTLLPIPATQAAAIQRLSPVNGEIVLGIRPEHVTDAASA
ncbi:ABC transporter ATP-binding protein, partial [Undibacterium sp. LFS511W]|nr:ABC transporter ATP-binding protein [Undibacterium luofuense]